jgi:hypothetical protein
VGKKSKIDHRPSDRRFRVSLCFGGEDSREKKCFLLWVLSGIVVHRIRLDPGREQYIGFVGLAVVRIVGGYDKC